MSSDGPVPFDGSPHSISIGVRKLDVTQWLALDDRAAKLAEKSALRATALDQIVATLRGSEAGGDEVLHMIVSHLNERDLVRVEGTSINDLPTGNRVETLGVHPLDAAAQLVGEDLCLMEVRPDEGPHYLLTAASVSFPSRWRLADKIGTSLQAIHRPVPGYETIEAATNRLFEAITVGRPLQRVNWTLIDDPDLFQPEPARRGADHAVREEFDDPAHQVHLRIERQTLRRLPHTGGVLFTIDTDVRPLSALSADQRVDLSGSLEGVDSVTVGYKGWSVLLPAVRQWAETAPS